MCKISAGIVLYQPELERLQENFDSALKQVDHLFLIDNHSDNIKAVEEMFSGYPNITFIKNDDNLGIAKALNQIMEASVKAGFDWVLTLDQDSVCADGLVESYQKYLDYEKVALITPLIIVDEGMELAPDLPPYEYIERCITSASLTKVSVWKEIGGFDEVMFIDYVDTDYCTMLLEHGYKILRDNQITLSHRLGDIKEVKSLEWIGEKFGIRQFKAPLYTHNHSPFRTYYYTRNTFYFIHKHRDFIDTTLEKKVFWRWMLLKFGFEKQKIAKFRAMRKGMKDAKRLIQEQEDKKNVKV